MPGPCSPCQTGRGMGSHVAAMVSEKGPVSLGWVCGSCSPLSPAHIGCGRKGFWVPGWPCQSQACCHRALLLPPTSCCTGGSLSPTGSSVRVRSVASAPNSPPVSGRRCWGHALAATGMLLVSCYTPSTCGFWWREWKGSWGFGQAKTSTCPLQEPLWGTRQNAPSLPSLPSVRDRA